MVKNTFVSMLVLTAACACAQRSASVASVPPGHCSVQADDAALRRLADDWKAGYNNGEPAKVAALYADNATYLTQHYATGIVQGRVNIQAYVKLGTDAKYKVDSIDVLSTTCSGDFAYTITRYQSDNGGQKSVGFNLVVLRKIRGKWLIVAHEAAVPDPANAIHHLEPATRP